jgi:hypothetical protein
VIKKILKIIHILLLTPFIAVGFILSFISIGVLSGWSLYVKFANKLTHEPLPRKN